MVVCDTEEFSVDESWLSVKRPRVRPLRDDLVDQEKERTEPAQAVSGPSGAAARLRMPASTLDSKIKSMRIDKRRFQVV